MSQLQQIWAQLNGRERLVAYGAGLTILAWIVGLVFFYGSSVGIIGLLGALVALGVMYANHAPNMKVTWPLPYPVILLIIGAAVGLLALVTLLQFVQIMGVISAYAAFGFGGNVVTALIPVALFIVGGALMAWGAYQEWNATKPAA